AEPPCPQPASNGNVTGFAPATRAGGPAHFRSRDQIVELYIWSSFRVGPPSSTTTLRPAVPRRAASKLPVAPLPTMTTSASAISVITMVAAVRYAPCREYRDVCRLPAHHKARRWHRFAGRNKPTPLAAPSSR